MFKNCTIAGNAGSGVYSHLQFFFEDWVGSDYSDDFLECGCEGVPSLVNCIIWNVNPLRVEWGYWDCYGDVEVTDPGQKGADIIYSCVQGGWYGQALDIDPQFVDPAAGDYRLQPGSPCIDTGTNDPVLDINVDIDGNARIWNGQVDMGAYEFDSEVPPPTPTATATPTATVTPTATPTGKATPPPRQLWLLDGFGHVYVLPSPTPTAEPGSELVVDLPGGVTMEMVLIPAGSFMMGRYPGEQDSYYYEDPQHMVTLSQDFYLGKYEVTQAQWQAVLGTPPWSAHRYVLDDPNSPAIYVSWNDISGTGGFIEKMNALGQGTFRLPSEAEWEYACRAQTAKRFYWGDDPSYSMIGDYAWYYNNAYAIGESYAHFVGQKLPNDWGLHDMSGNVSEWCQDYWHDSYDTNGGGVADAPTDGSAWELPTSSYRVVRGGYWGSHAQGCRSAYRGWGNPDYRFIEVGVRVARTR